MRHRSRQTDCNEELNIWPAFTDLMSNAFMIIILFLLITIFQSVVSQKGPKETGAPPIIVIKDTGAYQFVSGSAELPDKLYSYIFTDLVDKIEENAKKYQIDVIEVIGHTDGQSNGSKVSNLDEKLEQVASGALPVRNLQGGSNADLGLMRALEVVRALKYIQKQQGRLSGLGFRAYSAAQLISPEGGLSEIDRQPDATRRRIEIRFTRLGKVTNIQ